MVDHDWQSCSLSGSLQSTSNEAIPRAEPREPTPYISLYKPEAFYPESRPRAMPTAFQSSDNTLVSLETGYGRASFVPRCATNASALKVNSFYHHTMPRNCHAKRLALSSYPNSSLEDKEDLFQPKSYEHCKLRHCHASFPSKRAEFRMSRLEVQSPPVPSHVTWFTRNPHNYWSQNHAITEHTSAEWQCWLMGEKSIVRLSERTSLPQGRMYQPRERAKLPKRSVEIMKTWVDHNLDYPYPSEEQKQNFAMTTGISMMQVNNWFINHRRRCPELRERRKRRRVPIKMIL